ncbi:C39 family peptidase [Paraburkholderia dinghuensis]|uniref:Peptidase C39 n=1 Tax=Paraburkholderia dinghuensis TaxID=2305225 RepID=A0A3N6N8Q9_9BURK|nr:C39 family peptidase [Paraburkholderia dinghuensis]RQH05402.1 peptidase C39 [Paraburkholderia dinghuensis]
MKSVAVIVALAGGLAASAALADPIDVTDPSGGYYALHVTSLKEARFKRTIRQQFDFSCGSAAVATLLTYQYDYPVSEQKAFVDMFQNGDQAKIRREGFSLLDIRNFLASLGFQADGYEVPLEKLEQTHTPAIVLIVEHGYHHFVVIRGLRNGRVLIGDPATGTRAMSRESFEEKWQDRVVFVIHNKPQLARFNDERDWHIAPDAPLYTGISRSGLFSVVVPKLGPGEF